MDGMVFDIEKFAVHDGPGIRTVVFLKGCPLRCVWCHNPESQLAEPEILFSPEKCIGCGWCFECCPNRCHAMEEGRHVFRRESCVRCGKCAEKCYAGALENVGKPMSVEAVMAEVLEDRLFYDNSGGGLTLSGGEPLAQFEFTRELLAAAKKERLHTCVETCGFTEFTRLEALLPLVDLWLWDVKATGEELHRRLTGGSAAPILDNLRRMDAAGAALILRCPLIPGVNDGEAHLRHIAGLANTLKSVRRIDLEPYHPLGENKNRRLGREEGFSAPFVPEDRMKFYQEFLRRNTGVPVK